MVGEIKLMYFLKSLNTGGKLNCVVWYQDLAPLFIAKAAIYYTTNVIESSSLGFLRTQM